jgi:hypothetical protein
LRCFAGGIAITRWQNPAGVRLVARRARAKVVGSTRGVRVATDYGGEFVMTKTKRALTATAVTAAATAIALVPATAQARHAQPQPEVPSVTGLANFTQLSTHDRVLIYASGILDDGFGTVQIRNDNGTAKGKVVCVTGSRATTGFTDAAIGLHITRSSINGLNRGSDVIEYVRDGGRTNPDFSGLSGGGAICPDAGFTVPNGVLVQVPDNGTGNHNGFGHGDDRWNNGDNPWNDGRDRFDHGRHHRHNADRSAFRVTIHG